MHARTSSITRNGLLAVLVIALLAPGLAGCGVGPATKKEKISKTAVTYLNALADGDTATACAQLTHRAQGDHCQATLTARLPRLDRAALTSAADNSIDFSVHGTGATAGLSEPKGARLVLTETAGDWRIDSGYTLSTAVSAKIPATPVGRQLRWALAQLNGGAPRLRPGDVTARFTPEFRKLVMPVPAIIATLARTAAERGPFMLTGFAYPPTASRSHGSPAPAATTRRTACGAEATQRRHRARPKTSSPTCTPCSPPRRCPGRTCSPATPMAASSSSSTRAHIRTRSPASC